MNTSKIYKDSEGNDCTINQMVIREPELAASRIKQGEQAIEKLQQQTPLSNEEILKIINLINEEPLTLDDITASDFEIFVDLCKQIEKAHGIS